MTRASLVLGTLLFSAAAALATATGCSSNSADTGNGGDASSPVDSSVDSGVTGDASADTATPEAAVEAAAEASIDASGIDGGPPGVTPTTLNFGLVNCGATATAQTFTINNPSFTSVNWAATLGLGTTSSFTLSPAGGSLASGQSVAVTVTPKAVPASTSTSANALGDVVTVSLAGSSTTVTLQETAQGAVLGFIPTTLAFGQVPIASGATPSFFGVQNTGNVDANVTLTLTGDPSLSLPNAATTQMLTAAAGTTADSTVTFTPATTNPVTGSVALTTGASTVLCAPLPSALAISGTGSNGQVAVTPGPLVFGTGGLVPCGTTALPQNITIQNTGTASFTWTSTFAHGSSYYTLAPASGTVQPMTTTTVVVTPKPIPATSTTTAGQYDDTLTITTNVVGDSPHPIALQETAQGAILTRSTNSLGFGNVGIGVTSTNSVSFANTGNVTAVLTFANATSNFVQTSPVTVGAGTFASEPVSFSPTMTQPYQDVGTVALSSTVPLCGALPTSLALSGTGVNPTITVSPGTLSFGYIPCGQAGMPLSVTVQNNGPATTFTAAPLKGLASFFAVSPSSGSLPAGGSVQLTVTPQVLPVQTSPTPVTTGVNYYGDTLQIVTATSTILDVTLNQTALGAILTVSPAKIPFATLAPGASESTAVSVTNTGSFTAQVTLTPSLTLFDDGGVPDGGVDPFGVTPATISIPSGGSGPYSATFSPSGAGSYGGTLSVSVPQGTVLCAPLPAPVTVTGTGS